MAREKTSVKEKVEKEFPEFAVEVNSMSLADLEKRISTYAKEGEKVEEAKENDEALEEARARATELAAPYKDAKKAIRMKTRYLIATINDRGGDV